MMMILTSLTVTIGYPGHHTISMQPLPAVFVSFSMVSEASSVANTENFNQLGKLTLGVYC